ncbi:YwdI family protein [Bacillus benzoevorans]|uniref:Acyl-CoA reductase-like NAD-dependent aldehyde dehydrogenase n=1 Tax=Bacillus benzoevorans TaxID=1456 RepID=A0A7X0HTY6_9BACI|nr:YwdI family protein [Bacillus benzoevorans]MBB6445521.1 acyl-CoA reductase-like NAD-dependent aldehyde dehydrogenase [Bacillus benzoevorans]
MDISVNKLLDKIGAELEAAKRAGSTAKIRERAQAMKAICELILDESPAVKSVETVTVNKPLQQSFVPQKAPQMMPRQERMVMEDEANGESIFDF